MPATLSRPKSTLTQHEGPLRTALPEGLPPELASFYAKGDGLHVSFAGERLSARIVGLADAFDAFESVFEHHPHMESEEDFWNGELYGPFEETFWSPELLDELTLEQANLCLRLKLLASVAGESVAYGIDLFDPSGPAIYHVDLPFPHRLDLDFTTFVTHFSKFGTARWTYAFLDDAAQETMNIDLLKEFDRSMAGFDPVDVAPLRRRFSAGRVPSA